MWFGAAIDFIQAEADRPFFCYLSTNAPHGPFLVDPQYSRPYKDQGVPSPMAEFYGMITNIDENMGRLTEFLERHDLAENTLLIFMTDNGTAAGYRGGHGFNAGMRGTKGSLYEGGHRVPCLIRWPAGGLHGGKDLAGLAAHIDMIPTLAELCELEIPGHAQLDGVSLAPLLREQTPALPEREIVVQFRQSSEPPEKGKATVMSGRWRLVNSRELYDVQADPGQGNDVASEHPEIVQRLREAYDAWWAEVSPGFQKFNRIVLGSEAENSTRLSSFDWHTRTAWSQGQVRSGAAVNSFWAVRVARAGRYRISLRRWPAEVNAPINAAVGGGKAIRADQARLKIGQIDLTKAVPDGAAKVVFDVDLSAGPAKLWTWLVDTGSDQSRGAYYVEVERL